MLPSDFIRQDLQDYQDFLGIGDVGAFAALLDNIWFFEVSWDGGQRTEDRGHPGEMRYAVTS